MNTIERKIEGDQIIYSLRGPLNSTLKSKLKNKASKILNNSNLPRILSTLIITNDDSEETHDLIEKVKTVKPDLLLPAVQLAFISNKFNTNILSNSKKGTYIKLKNKNNYFKNIGNPTETLSNRLEYFLRKGIGSKLIKYAIKDMKDRKIKSILLHPLKKGLEHYYREFGFEIIKNVPTNIGRKQYYGKEIEGHIMLLEL
jgi:hypothetical protein